MANRLVDDKNRIDELDNGYALKILGYMLQEMRDMLPDQQAEVKQMIVVRVIQTVSDDQITETAFIPVYNAEIFRRGHLIIICSRVKSK